MADIQSKIREIYSLEQLSGRRSAVHDRHPMVKLISTIVFIITVVSFNIYQFGRLLPFVFFPFVLMALSDTPWMPVLKRVALTIPFCILAGVSNMLFYRATAFVIGGFAVSFGVISFLSIIFRTFLCVTAVLILVATTPFPQIADQLRMLHVPDIFVTLFEMTYRYIGALLEEASTMYTAYMLRSTEKKGLQMKHMGSFVGQLLIRSYDRAERVYAAMKCRGYGSGGYRKNRRALDSEDYVFLAAACLPFILLRIFNLSSLFESLF